MTVGASLADITVSDVRRETAEATARVVFAAVCTSGITSLTAVLHEDVPEITARAPCKSSLAEIAVVNTGLALVVFVRAVTPRTVKAFVWTFARASPTILSIALTCVVHLGKAVLALLTDLARVVAQIAIFHQAALALSVQRVQEKSNVAFFAFCVGPMAVYAMITFASLTFSSLVIEAKPFITCFAMTRVFRAEAAPSFAGLASTSNTCAIIRRAEFAPRVVSVAFQTVFHFT